MIAIPFPIFIAVSIVLCMGFIANINKYVRIAFLVIYLGFWFSFKSSDSPAIESLDVNTLYLIGMVALPVIVLVMAIYIFYLKK